MNFLGRIVLVIVAFIISAICAFSALVFLTGSLLDDMVVERPPETIDPFFVADYFAILIVLGYGVLIASAATVLAVVVGELSHIRSWMYYVLASGLAFAATPIIAAYPPGSGLPNADLMTICASAGFGSALAATVAPAAAAPDRKIRRFIKRPL